MEIRPINNLNPSQVEPNSETSEDRRGREQKAGTSTGENPKQKKDFKIPSQPSPTPPTETTEIERQLVDSKKFIELIALSGSTVARVRQTFSKVFKTLKSQSAPQKINKAL